MENDTTDTQPMSISSRDVLTDILRQGAQKMLAEAIENEVVEYLDRHACMRDDQGHRLAVRNGYVSDKFFQARRMPVGALGMWGLAIVCFFHPQLAAWSHLGNAIGISLIGLFTYGPDALMSGAAAIDAGSPKLAGLAAGVINGVGYFGQMVSGFVVAYIANRLSWISLFYFFVIIALIVGCLLTVKWNWVPQACKQTGEGS